MTVLFWVRTHKFLASVPILFGLLVLFLYLRIADFSYPFGFYVIIGSVVISIRWLSNRRKVKEANNAKK